MFGNVSISWFALTRLLKITFFPREKFSFWISQRDKNVLVVPRAITSEVQQEFIIIVYYYTSTLCSTGIVTIVQTYMYPFDFFTKWGDDETSNSVKSSNSYVSHKTEGIILG